MNTEYEPSHTERSDVMALFDTLKLLYFDCMEDLQPPIHSLPAEVLEEIFQRCLPTAHLPILSSSEGPILLTQVCNLWRNVALSSPTLWTAVHIPVPSSRVDDHLYRAFKEGSAGATWWLNHVARLNCALTLSLHWPDSPSDTFGRREDFVRTVIGACSHFVRELDLHLPNEILKMVLNKPTYIFPKLEKITLRKGSGIEDTCLWETPTLRKVVWDGVKGNIFETQLKWHSMEEISVKGPLSEYQTWFSYEDARALLQGTGRNLLKLGIQLKDSISSREYSSTLIRAMQSRRTDSAAGSDPDRRELCLPRLQTLTMVVSSSQPQRSAPHLCNLLQLPALRSLSYAHRHTTSSFYSQVIQEPHPLFILLSVQSHPVAITTLIIDATSISRAMFLRCVRLTPSLSRLWVKDTRPTKVERGQPNSGMTVGNTDKEVVLDDRFLGDFLPTFCYDIPIECSYDYNFLCPLLTDVRFDRAWFTLNALKNFVHTRLSFTAVGAATVECWVDDDFSEGPQAARLKSVHVGLAYRGARGSDVGLEYELRESNLSVSISFAVEHEDARPAPRLYRVVDPKDGLRAIDEWM